jgi:hypothetical protein
VQNKSMNAREQAIRQLKIETGTEYIPYHIMTTNNKGQLQQPKTMTDDEWQSFLDWDN